MLHAALVRGLSAMCGERLGRVGVEFLEPQHASALGAANDGDEADGDGPDAAPGPDGQATESAPDATTDGAHGITIPMRPEREE